ncbi:hypothetical protein [Methylocella sp.]|uniref:hypothetical protein n=1 Tax=Methylocella sp. TaxID=1978226 RepID=UPI003782D34B
MRKALALSMLAVLASACGALAEKPTRFWNLTSKTVSELRLAPAGTQAFGENQTLNDKDKTVDHDERVAVKGVESGVYDVKVGLEDGKTCLARNVKVEKGEVFSIEDKELECK